MNKTQEAFIIYSNEVKQGIPPNEIDNSNKYQPMTAENRSIYEKNLVLFAYTEYTPNAR